MGTADDATGRFSVAFPRRHWYPACRSDELGREPRAVELMETPLALFRGRDGAAHAVVDRCPHRNAPLSLGRVDDHGRLACGYHGWCFDGSGACVSVPGLQGDPSAPARSVPSHAVAEADGFVWVWGEPDVAPSGRPFPLPDLSARPDRRRTGRTSFVCDLDSTMHAALENALDVPHTAFLHRGVFRGNKDPREITAVRRELPGGLEVQYLGEPIGFGPLTLSSEQTARSFEHWDRFFLPSIAQIEYAVPGWLRIVNTILHLPMGPFRTRAWFVLDFSSPLPTSVAAAIIKGRGRTVLRQDAEMLAAQTATVRRFGGERHTSTELDLLGRGIWRLLRQAERAEHGDAETVRDDDPDDGDVAEASVTLRI